MGRPGRPKLSLILTTVRLSKGMAERIDSVAGEYKRGKFIREAVERELKRREKAKARKKS